MSLSNGVYQIKENKKDDKYALLHIQIDICHTTVRKFDKIEHKGQSSKILDFYILSQPKAI